MVYDRRAKLFSSESKLITKQNVHNKLDEIRMPTDEWHLANRIYSLRITSILLKLIIYLNKNATARPKYTQIQAMRMRIFFVATGESVSTSVFNVNNKSHIHLHSPVNSKYYWD